VLVGSSHFKTVLKAEMAAVGGDLSSAELSNKMLCAYVRAQCFAMRRQGAAEALEDMLESRRIYEDLTLACLEPAFSMDIVFRTWNDALVPGEFFPLYWPNLMERIMEKTRSAALW
jgi:hypothetical protein